MSYSYQPNQVQVIVGTHPLFPGEKLIKVCVADSIGYAETETESIQLIEKLRNW